MQLTQLLLGTRKPAAARRQVQLRLPRAMEPPQAVTFGEHHRLVADREAVDELALVVCLVPQRLPDDLAVERPRAKGRVFLARARQHADETAAVSGDVVHVVDRGQLAVGDVEEVAAAGDLAEQIPVLPVGRVVGDVPAGRAEMDGHAAVVADGEDVQELLQVRAMVLAVPPGDRQRLLVSTQRLLGRFGVGPEEGHGGGIIVQLVHSQGELPHDVANHLQHHCRPVAVEEDAQAASCAIVIERQHLLGGEPQRGGIVTGGPLAQTVDRFPGEEQVLHQQQQSSGDRQLAASVLWGQVSFEDLFQVHPLEDLVDDRQGADRRGTQGSLVETRHRSQIPCGRSTW